MLILVSHSKKYVQYLRKYIQHDLFSKTYILPHLNIWHYVGFLQRISGERNCWFEHTQVLISLPCRLRLIFCPFIKCICAYIFVCSWVKIIMHTPTLPCPSNPHFTPNTLLTLQITCTYITQKFTFIILPNELFGASAFATKRHYSQIFKMQYLHELWFECFKIWFRCELSEAT